MTNRVDISLVLRSLIHEIRQPLSGMRTSLQLASEAGQEIDPDDLRIVTEQAQRIEEILSGYHLFATSEPLPREPFRAAPALERAAQVVAQRAAPLGDRFVRSIDADLPLAWGSHRALTHALTNLLNNALDATALLLGAARIAVDMARTNHDFVTVRVSDNGAGVDEQDRDALFTPYHTTKRAEGGSGLGLYIARDLLRRSGASIDLVAALEHQHDWSSTEFLITIPVATESGPLVEVAPRPSVEKRATTEPLSILLVEDEPVIVEVLKRSLLPIGHRLSIAASGEEGLALMKAKHFDLLLTDKNLPTIDGVEVAKRARALEPGIAVVVITGYPSLESVAELLPLNIDGYLRKPFDLDAFVEGLPSVVTRRRRLHEKGPPLPAPGDEVFVIARPSPMLDLLKESLGDGGLKVTVFKSAEPVLQRDLLPPWLIVSHEVLTEPVRAGLLHAVRSDKRPEILLIHPRASLDDNIAAIDLGVRAIIDDLESSSPEDFSRALWNGLTGREDAPTALLESPDGGDK